MKLLKVCVLSFSLLSLSAFAQSEPELFKLKDDRARTGSHIKKDLFTGPIPYDKTYEELTPEQKAILRSRYENMPATDDPPFPLDGLAPLYRVVAKGLERFKGWESLEIYVTVDETGLADQAEVVKAPDEAMGKFAAQAMLLTKYRPAQCSGKPCKMQYRLLLNRKL